MKRISWRVVWMFGALSALFSITRVARAADAKSPPSFVVPFASDDADENAEAFTGAFRARVRSTPGWTLGDAGDTLELYTTALRCPEHPDAACIDRIGGSLKTDRFFWGYVKKGEKGTVLAEVHLWRKGKGDTSTTETFSDNLRDQNDEVLRRIAGHAFAQLVGEIVPAVLTVNVHPSEVDAVVAVDGKDLAPLDQGQVTAEINPGVHTITVHSKGFKTARYPITLAPGKEAQLDAKLEKGVDEPPPPPPKPLPAQKILAVGALVAAGGFAIAGTIETAEFLSASSQHDDDVKSTGTTNVCDGGHPTQCETYGEEKTARVLMIVFYGATAVFAGTGVVLFLTDHSDDTDAAPPPKKSAWNIVPDVGPHRASLDFALTF